MSYFVDGNNDVISLLIETYNLERVVGTLYDRGPCADDDQWVRFARKDNHTTIYVKFDSTKYP